MFFPQPEELQDISLGSGEWLNRAGVGVETLSLVG